MSTSDALRDLEARFAAGNMTRAEYSARRRELLLPAAGAQPEQPRLEPTEPQLDEPSYAPDPAAAGPYPPPPWASSSRSAAPTAVASAAARSADVEPDSAEPSADADAPAPTDPVPDDSAPTDAAPADAPGFAPPGVAYERQPPAWASSGSDAWLPLADTWVADAAPDPPPEPPTPVASSPPQPMSSAPPAADPVRTSQPMPISAPDSAPEPVVVHAPTPSANAAGGALDFSSRLGRSAAPDAPVGAPPGAAPTRSDTVSGGGGVRRAWIAVLALVVLVAAGILVWRLTSSGGNSTASATSSSAPAPVSPSPSVGSTRPASPTPTPPLRADAQHPFGILPGTTVSPQGSGPGTLADARSRNVNYPIEVVALEECGATSGSTVVMLGEGWSLSGTVFGCSDATGARTVLSRLATFETTTLGFAPAKLSNPQVLAFFSNRNPPTPGYPAQFHVRYRSGVKVIGLVFQAKSEKVGRKAAEQVVAAASTFYPPTG